MARRILTLLALTLACSVVAGPALADPAGPTHYRSTLTGVQTADGEPTDVDLAVRILGGDSFFVVRAPAGQVVEVPGYDGEPYVRIDADGSVHVNERSPARWLNDARFGEQDVEVPASADEDAPPAWQQVASDGEYAWHDHRIHFMSPSLPSGVDPSVDGPQAVMDWEVPVAIDGEVAVFTGELVWIAGPSPALPIGALVLAAAAAIAVVVRRPDATTVLLGVGIVLTGAVGTAKSIGLPAGADGEPAVLVLPAMALVAVLVGGAIRRRGDRRGAWLRDAAGIPIGVWGILQIGSLTRPIVPGPLPVEVVRGVTILALAVGIAAVVALARRVLQATRLDLDDDPAPDGSPPDGSGRDDPDAEAPVTTPATDVRDDELR